MNISESIFLENAKSQGYTVLRRGWPDFAVIGPDGSLFCVEVKDTSGLSEEQKEMIEFLTLSGIPCYVSWRGEFPKLERPLNRSDLEKPLNRLDLEKSLKLLNLKNITERYERDTEEYKCALESKYYHRLERVEEILRQIKRLCES